MKFTQYFHHIRLRPETVKNPDHTEVQSDGRIRKWKKIKEEGKVLRVILLPDGETVHNVFFDRGLKGGTK